MEQWAISFEPTYKKSDSSGAFTISPRIRYNTGFSRLYADVDIEKFVGKDYRKQWVVSVRGGNYIFQLNPSNPISNWNNSIATLLYSGNHMKGFQKTYGSVEGYKVIARGLTLSLRASFEDRKPLENTDTVYRWRTFKDRSFTPNYPPELPEGFFDRHQAFLTNLRLTFQPGVKYIQYPDRLRAITSTAPIFTFTLDKAWQNIFGADASFAKWQFGVTDDFNLKLGGSFNYNLAVGGFLSNDFVHLPDWQHFNGNQTIIASTFLNSFQLAPYYANSTNNGTYTMGHVEWHLNGLMTNKIPLVKKANVGLVTGANAFLVDKNRNYSEVFVGLENIGKVFRIDYVWGWNGNARTSVNGIVVGVEGFFADMFKKKK